MADRKLDDVFAADRRDELLRGAEGDDAAMIHDGDAVAEALGLLHVMGGEDDGAAGLLELVDQVPEMAAGLGVEAGGGLVEKEQFRVAHQGAGHGQALLLAAGETADPGMALLLKLRGADGLVDRRCRGEKSCETGAASPRR